jgi:hypothetical protein
MVIIATLAKSLKTRPLEGKLAGNRNVQRRRRIEHPHCPKSRSWHGSNT